MSELLATSKMVVAFTGHRPPKLDMAWDGRSSADVAIRADMTDWLLELGCTDVITGMALGIDTNAARVAYQMGLPYHAYVPFKGQEGRWPAARQADYHTALGLAASVVYTSSGGYNPAKMQVRNEYMADNCDVLLAYWDGSAGGTANCLRYADYKGVRIINSREERGLYLAELAAYKEDY